MNSITCMTDRDNNSIFLYYEQQEKLNPIFEKIQNLSNKTSRIAILTSKNWLKEFMHQTYTKSALKILALPLYGGLLWVGALTFYSSLILLINGKYSDAFSSDVDVRVNFANDITNGGALFACTTDLPAFTYLLYLLEFNTSYRKAIHEIWDESYHSCVDEDDNITKEMHEELYQQYISKLQSLGFNDFYSNPDLASTTGSMYEELAPLLKEIDQELKKGVSFSDVIKNCIETFKQESWAKKLAKLTAGSISLFVIGVASFLLIENSILIQGTELSDLFSSDKTKQNDEAFKLTQLGGLFSSLMALGLAAYVPCRLFLQASYEKIIKKTQLEKIKACFAKYKPEDNFSIPVRNALYRIIEFKLKGSR